MPRRALNKRVLERDWLKLLTRVSEEQVKTLREDHSIGKKHWPTFKICLEDLVKGARVSLEIVHNETLLSSNRAEAERLLVNIDRVVRWVQLFDKKLQYNLRPGREYRFGIAAEKALAQAAGANLSPIFDPWFVSKFVGGYPASLRGDGTVESVKFDFEEGRKFVENLVTHNPEQFLVVVLERVKITLLEMAEIMKRNTSKGGPRRYVVAPWLLSNLAEVYFSFGPGKSPSTDPEGPFGRFARDVVDAMGLPTDWIERQIRPAVAQWERRTRLDETPAEKNRVL